MGALEKMWSDTMITVLLTGFISLGTWVLGVAVMKAFS